MTLEAVNTEANKKVALSFVAPFQTVVVILMRETSNVDILVPVIALGSDLLTSISS